MSRATEVLISVDPARNRYRFYRIAIWPDLFAGYTVVREWGRIGRPGRLKSEPCPTLSDAEITAAQLTEKKRKRGYTSMN